jgi:hypothetical protein
MKTGWRFSICNLLVPAALALHVSAVWAAEVAKVFPVKGFFYDDAKDSKLDPGFRAHVATMKPAALADRVHQALEGSLAGKIGQLDKNTAGRTFTASFHVTRATSFSVDKGNGNSDILASVTASLYFTNITTGEILTTISRSVVSRAVVDGNADMDVEKGKLFTQALDTLIVDLAGEASKKFSPVVVETAVVDQVGDLLVLDAGYAKGFQAGDQLNSSQSQLIDVVYAAENYSIAVRVVADGVAPGSVFQKYLSQAADGKDRKRTVVLVESLPNEFSKNYIAQIFSELVGDTTPLTVVQVNPSFQKLLSTVVQQASISQDETTQRQPPGLFIRLRVAEPIMYEVKTNLDFETIRHYETLAFADIVDTSGLVNFSVVGKDVIDDKITSNIGPGFAERREVSVKNALTDLASKLASLTEPKRVQAEVLSGTSEGANINIQGKAFQINQEGVLLRMAKVRFGSGSRQILIPSTHASVEAGEDNGQARIRFGAPFDMNSGAANPGDVFEIQRIGTPPRSAQAFAICGPSESLGTTNTPLLMEMTGLALGKRMPGMMYVPEIAGLTNGVIGQDTGFKSAVPWAIPRPGICIQPVERVNQAADQCDTQCERPITARYTLRIKSDAGILSRVGFESQFKSTGFYKQTQLQHLKSLIDVDLIDEAQTLLDKAADKVSFPSL